MPNEKEIQFTQNQKSYIKDLLSHSGKILMGTIITGFFAMLVSSYVFYHDYKTIVKNDSSQDKSIQKIEVEVKEVNQKVSYSNEQNNITNMRIENIDNEMLYLKEQMEINNRRQEQILNTLLEIRNK